MGNKKMYILLLMIGLGVGVLFGLHKARASSPEGETSGGEQPASVYYDEFWQASAAMVSSDTGYKQINPSGHADTGTAAAFNANGQVSSFPKMVVTQWTVHGHIHFE